MKTIWTAGLLTVGLMAAQTSTAANLEDYQNSWEFKALQLQERMDMGEPLGKAHLLKTHNSYNSEAYRNLGSYYDPNQKLSLVAQLDMGIRAIELDVHDFNGDLLLCHGQSNHTGCSIFDRKFEDGIKEVASWLTQANHRDQMIILYIEEHVDGRYNDLMQVMNQHLGSLIYKPANCQSMPTTISKADVINAGKQVIVIGGNCATTGWSQFAYNGNYPTDNDSFYAWPDCRTDKYSTAYIQSHVVRMYEDSTNLSSWFGDPPPDITPDRMRQAMECGFGVIGLDQLEYFDSRLRAAIWSWGENEPNNWNNAEDCATQRGDGRFNDLNCSAQLSFACYHAANDQWAVTSGAGDWTQGDAYCSAELGAGWRFDVPRSAWQNKRLLTAKEAQGVYHDVWLNYSDRVTEGDWKPVGFPALTPPGNTQPVVYRKLRNDKGKCLDLEGRSTSNGTEIHQWSCHGADSQLWYQDSQGLIRNKMDPNKCMDVSGAGTGKGARVHLWSCHGGANQVWQRGVSNTFRPAHAPHMVLDIKDPFWGNGQRAHLWTYHGGKSQRWAWD